MRAALAALAFGAASSFVFGERAGAQPFVSISSVPVEAPQGFHLAQKKVRVIVEWAPNVAEAQRHVLTKTAAVETKDGESAFLYAAYPAVDAEAKTDAYAKPSFIVDYDVAKIFAPVRAEAEKRFGLEPRVADLIALTSERIPKKDLERGLDAASIALKRGEGDCTEHAAVLAALLRMFGRPARIVTGVAVVELEGKLFAAGHAWVEYYDGKAWRLADATDLPASTLYIPLALGRETASQAKALVEDTSIVHVKKIRLVPVE